MRVVAVIGTYPLLTTTFVDREIRALRRLGVEVDVLAIRRPAAHVPLSAEQRALRRGVTYVLPVGVPALLRSHAWALLTHPRRYLRVLAWLLSRPHPSARARWKTLLHFGEAVHAAWLLRRRPGDELLAHFADRAATVCLVAARLLGRPWSLSVHAGADVFVAPVLLREKLQAARRVVTCTRRTRQVIAQVAGPEVAARTVHVPHGLDLARYRAGPRQPADPPVVLVVAQLKERKGLAHLLAACALLRAEGVRLACRIVGAGPQRAALERAVRDLGLDGVVTLCGALAHERVLAEYGRASVFALPCVQAADGDVDGLPNALAEAMALEVPVVSTDLPAIRELVTGGVDGLLVPPGDEAALAAALRRLLAEPDLRRRLAAGARATVAARFDLEANAARLAATLWPDAATARRVREAVMP